MESTASPPRQLLVCLHGWGGTKESFTELREALQDGPRGGDIELVAWDLPGFGSEPEPPQAFSTDDYVEWVERKLAPLAASGRPLLLLGHSHGGRIAIKIAARGRVPIAHLYLCAAAGIRHPRHFKRILGLTLAKTGKFFLSIPGLRSLAPLGRKLLYRLVRVHDYEQASPVMRETLLKVSAEDLRPLLSQVRVPTDIFWGTDDRMTPLSDGQLMHREIRGSRLHTYPGVRHRVHRERAREIAEIIRCELAARKN
jgi:pimeloyl-ACP methyl ester carboxylesterase